MCLASAPTTGNPCTPDLVAVLSPMKLVQGTVVKATRAVLAAEVFMHMQNGENAWSELAIVHVLLKLFVDSLLCAGYAGNGSKTRDDTRCDGK